MKKKIIKVLPKIINNSKYLLADANLLYQNKRKERAYSIFQLAIEEISKAFYLVGVIIFENDENPKRILKNIRSHKFKTKKSIGLEYTLIQLLKNISQEKYELAVRDSILEFDSIDDFNNKKNYGFYTTFIDSNNSFKSPSELITVEDVKSIKKKAELRVWVGDKLLPPMIKNIDVIKEKAQGFNFENSKSHNDHILELKRIIEKYDI